MALNTMSLPRLLDLSHCGTREYNRLILRGFTFLDSREILLAVTFHPCYQARFPCKLSTQVRLNRIHKETQIFYLFYSLKLARCWSLLF